MALYERLSEHTAYQQFFVVMRRLPPDWAHHLAEVDYQRRLALVAERGEPGEPELVGVARYEGAQATDAAEVAIVVQDGWQGRGLGRVLLHDLVRAGQARGFQRFRAYVLAENTRMLAFLARDTEILDARTDNGVRNIVFTSRPP
jgi:RimJ/RimL family protein N-acetyltransferase